MAGDDAKDYTCTTCGKTFRGLGYLKGSQHTVACAAKRKSDNSVAESKRSEAQSLEDEFKANKPKSVRKKEAQAEKKKQYQNA